MNPGFELFDHTADIGVRVRADSLPGLIRPATEGLYAVIGELLPAGAGRAERFALTGADPALLLHDYLAELLLLFYRERRMLTAVNAEQFADGRLVVSGVAREVSAADSTLVREAKAVTYHELEIRPVAGGYEATFIVDI